MNIRRILRILLLILLIAIYGLSNSRTVQLRADRPPEALRAQALAVDPTLLKIISGPFKGLMANYLILKASVFMGGVWKVTQEDWDAVYTLLRQSLFLDPLFFQTGYYIQGLLVWRTGMQAKAIELLNYQAEQRYWDWEIMFYLGFDHFFYLKDIEKAAEYMRKAALRPGAAPIAGSLAARLSQQSGQTLTAIALLKTMLEQAEDGHARALYESRLEAYIGIHQLEQAIEAYEKSRGRKPETLEQLVSDGILAALPTNPFGDHFIYEPSTGKVFFDDVR
jgi:tetratricopeptide (TPR) repeat protein